jgi:serine-type D-Ala-D-Ala carboxypeptidase/endopeptidase (penicillin-binding protein 4)
VGRQDSQPDPGDETVRLPPPQVEQTQTIRLPSFLPPPPPPHQPPAPPRQPPSPPQPRPPRRRPGLGAVLTVLVLLAGLGAATVVVRPGPVAAWLGETAASPSPAPPTPEPSPSPVLVASAADAPAPTAEGVRAVLDPLMVKAGLGGRTHISVADVLTGGSLYARGPDVRTVPASTTKLATAAAVLAARGPAYRITTRVVAGARPGEVVIVGGGDPTLAINATGSYPGAARLDQLAKQVKQALGGAALTRVTVDATLFTGPVYEPSWDPDIPTGGFGGPTSALMTDGARINPKQSHGYAERHPKADIAAGQAFARALGLPASAVKAVARGKAPAATSRSTPDASPAPPAPGTELGTVGSPPMLRLVEFMLGESDNVVAEALARQVALAEGQPASYAGGAAATRAVLAELGLPATEIALSDGSGLSRKNALTPTLLTDLLTLAADGSHPELAGLVAGLPVAAWSGTLRERYRSPATANRPGAGVVRAKTGTLSGVNAIAGVVVTADGRLLAFAVLADKVPLDKARAEAALDKIPATLAQCGCV